MKLKNKTSNYAVFKQISLLILCFLSLIVGLYFGRGFIRESAMPWYAKNYTANRNWAAFDQERASLESTLSNMQGKKTSNRVCSFSMGKNIYNSIHCVAETNITGIPTRTATNEMNKLDQNLKSLGWKRYGYEYSEAASYGKQLSEGNCFLHIDYTSDKSDTGLVFSCVKTIEYFTQFK